jgi:hypothetical protein
MMNEKLILLLASGKSDAKSLPFILPLLLNEDQDYKSEQISESILKILRQKDFSSSTYILSLAEIIELHKVRPQNPEFWR